MRTLFTRVATGALAAAVSTGFLVATAAPASAAGCTTRFDTYSTVTAGTKGTKARAVECLLLRDGFHASQNSSFSSADAGQLRRFQSKHLISATGASDAATWAALVSRGSRPALRPGQRSGDVRRLQLALRALGHPELPGTTLYGDLTEAAVKDFQGDVGLPVTGRTGSAEWTRLQNGSARAAGSTSGSSGKATTSSKGSKGSKALAYAKKQLGEKYKYGAAGPDRWDCSGLTMKAWASAGVKLPHSAAAQYRIGTKVKKSDLRPGDLVFFYSGPSHVGIYAGGGRVVHSPKPGSKVSYIKLAYMPWKGARRPG